MPPGPDRTEDAPLRYADGPRTEAVVDIAAPPAVVWALVSDITTPLRFSGELIGVEWLGDERGAGARFVGRSHHDAIGTWETTSTVTVCDGTVFEWAVADVERPSATWRYTLEPIDGGTRLAFGMRMGPGPSGITPAIEAMPDKEDRILRRRLAELRANMEATLDGVRALAEGR